MTRTDVTLSALGESAVGGPAPPPPRGRHLARRDRRPDARRRGRRWRRHRHARRGGRPRSRPRSPDRALRHARRSAGRDVRRRRRRSGPRRALALPGRRSVGPACSSGDPGDRRRGYSLHRGSRADPRWGPFLDARSQRPPSETRPVKTWSSWKTWVGGLALLAIAGAVWWTQRSPAQATRNGWTATDRVTGRRVEGAVWSLVATREGGVHEGIAQGVMGEAPPAALLAQVRRLAVGAYGYEVREVELASLDGMGGRVDLEPVGDVATLSLASEDERITEGKVTLMISVRDPKAPSSAESALVAPSQGRRDAHPASRSPSAAATPCWRSPPTPRSRTSAGPTPRGLRRVARRSSTSSGPVASSSWRDGTARRRPRARRLARTSIHGALGGLEEGRRSGLAMLGGGGGYEADASMTGLAFAHVPRVPLTGVVRTAAGWFAVELDASRETVPVPRDGSPVRRLAAVSVDGEPLPEGAVVLPGTLVGRPRERHPRPRMARVAEASDCGRRSRRRGRRPGCPPRTRSRSGTAIGGSRACSGGRAAWPRERGSPASSTCAGIRPVGTAPPSRCAAAASAPLSCPPARAVATGWSAPRRDPRRPRGGDPVRARGDRAEDVVARSGASGRPAEAARARRGVAVRALLHGRGRTRHVRRHRARAGRREVNGDVGRTGGRRARALLPLSSLERGAELRDGEPFELTHALAGQVELLPDLAERHRVVAIVEAVAQPEDRALALGEARDLLGEAGGVGAAELEQLGPERPRVDDRLRVLEQGVERDGGRRPALRPQQPGEQLARAAGPFMARAISSVSGSRPSRWAKSRAHFRQRVSSCDMCRGMRTVFTVFTSPRRIACWIHQVAYVEKRIWRAGSNSSAAWTRPTLPSSTRSGRVRPRPTQRLATETTSRRLLRTSFSRASACSWCSSSGSWISRARARSSAAVSSG